MYYGSKVIGKHVPNTGGWKAIWLLLIFMEGLRGENIRFPLLSKSALCKVFALARVSEGSGQNVPQTKERITFLPRIIDVHGTARIGQFCSAALKQDPAKQSHVSIRLL